jgi:uncharacterized lipoprotein YajG
MAQKHRLGGRLAAFVVALMLLAGCGASGTSTGSTPTATAAACTAADAYVHAVTNFKDSLQAGSTVEQVRTAGDQVTKTYNDLNKALENVSKARLDALKTAEDRLAAAVKGLSNDATLAQALDSLKQEAKDVQAALSDVLADINC